MATRKSPPSARDTGKMIRQLSLVAYLMAHRRRRVDAATIRWNVEGYGDEDQSWETFTRTFHRDREELARLGIEIRRQRSEAGDHEHYWLPPESYFLPAVEFSREELTALNACLCLLDGQFAYSRLLRLALQGLSLGSGNPLDDPVTDCFAINLISSGYDEEVAARQREIENAVSRQKTVVFDYHALSTGATETRSVDPYAQMLTSGDWYLVGYSHERRDIRIFKLRRIQGRIRALSKSEHDFNIPDEFRVQDYLNLEPWQLGPVTGEAEIFFSPRMGWWAANNLSGGGAVETKGDGSAILRTPYSDGGALCSLVLGMREDARFLEPAELRAKMVSALERIRSAHEGAVPALPKEAGAGRFRANRAAATGKGKARAGGISPAGHGTDEAGRDEAKAPGHETPQVPPERLLQMAKTISYLLDRLGKQETVTLPVDEVCHDLGFENRKALQQAIDLLRLVNVGAGGYLVEAYVKGGWVQASGGLEEDLLKRPAHLSPREARALLLAIDLVGSQLLGSQYQSLGTARQKIFEAAGGFGEQGAIAVGESEMEDLDICRVINSGLKEHRLVEIEYLSQSADEPEARRIEPYLLNRVKGQWYLHAWCRERNAMRTFRLEMIKSARLPGEEFKPREDEGLDLGRYVRDPRFPSGEEAPYVAEVRFSPEMAGWMQEKQSNTTWLEDGSVISRIPYFDAGWLVSEVLKYAGEAELISPAELRGRVALTAARLASGYG